MSLFDLSKLSLTLPSSDGSRVPILEDISLDLDGGECVALVGESGCGKSMTALALMGLAPMSARISGQALLQGRDLLTLNETEYRRVRGRQIAMIFQEPMTALNPVQPIGRQVAEGPRLHFGLGRRDAKRRAERLLDRVGLPASRFPLNLYPHQLSGGQRQRVVTAIALSCEPKLLIADEPTTALDVVVQEQIMRLILDIVEEKSMGLLLITHDLGVVAASADRVNVMYAGRLVERAPVGALFRHAEHPYTRGLLDAVPRLQPAASDGGGRLQTIPGSVPPPERRPPGCYFAERCARARADCRRQTPTLSAPGERAAACFYPHRQDAA